MCMSLEGTEELPHFHLTSFRVKSKIYATLDENLALVRIMLRPEEQDSYCQFDSAIVYPVPGRWGLRGATCFELEKVRKETLESALMLAYAKLAVIKRKK